MNHEVLVDYTGLRSRIEARNAQRQSAETNTAEGSGVREIQQPARPEGAEEPSRGRRGSETGEAAAPKVTLTGPNKTEKLQYKDGHDTITVFVRRRPHGWTVDAAVNAFVESALREGSGG